MAAPNDAILGVDMKLVYQNDPGSSPTGSLIGTQTESSLSVSPDVREIILKNVDGGNPTDWKGRLSGTRDWELSHDGLVLNSDGDYDIANGNITLKMNVDTSDDDTENASLIKLPYLESIDFTITQELAEIGNLDQGVWNTYRPAEREFSIDVTGSLIDPNADFTSNDDYDIDNPYKPIYDRIFEAGSSTSAIESVDVGDPVELELEVFNKTFTGDVIIGDVNIDASTGGEDATMELSLSSKGALTFDNSGNDTDFDDSVDDIFDAIKNENPVYAGMLKYVTDNNSTIQQTGAMKLTGQGYWSEVSISASNGEELTVSSTLQGDGPLTRNLIS